MKLSLTLAALMAVTGSAALAQLATDGVIADLKSQGYTRIEIQTGLFRTRVEATRGTEKTEVVYDNATGDVVGNGTASVRPGDRTSQGAAVPGHNRSLARVSTSGAATAASGNDGEDQASGTDDGAGHDAADDNGELDGTSAGETGDDDHVAGGDDGADQGAENDSGDPESSGDGDSGDQAGGDDGEGHVAGDDTGDTETADAGDASDGDQASGEDDGAGHDVGDDHDSGEKRDGGDNGGGGDD